MTMLKKQLIITQTDHDKLVDLVKNGETSWFEDALQKKIILDKLATAKIIPDSDFPRDIARLYSTITLRDTIVRINHTYTLVLPNEIGGKSDYISVFSPFGFELLGKGLGSSFTWIFKTKRKYFLVADLTRSYSETFAY